MSQGNSTGSTPFKVQGMQFFTERNLYMYRAALQKFREKGFPSNFPYWYFDLNCGCGYNPKADERGSPVVFLQATQKVGITNYKAFFCDDNNNAIFSLREKVGDNHRVTYSCMENKKYLRGIPSLIARSENLQHAMGSLLIDPNNLDVPWNELAVLNKSCPKIDIVIHFNNQANRRVRGRGDPDRPPLEELITRIGKKQGIVRGQKGQFAMVILTNYTNAADWKKNKYFSLKSKQGQRTLEKLDTPMVEYIQKYNLTNKYRYAKDGY